MGFSIYHMKVILLVDSIDFHNGKTNIFDAPLLGITLEHPVKQPATVLLRRHTVLCGSRYRINEVAIVAYYRILFLKEKFGYCIFYSNQHIMTRRVIAGKSAQLYTDNGNILQGLKRI